MKNIDNYLSLNYRKVVYQDEDGDYIVEVPDLPGCAADGSTPNDAFENLHASMRSWLESRIEAGLAIPEPKDPETFSGRLLLRMPKFLHRRLAELAEAHEASLNQFLITLLSDASARVESLAVSTPPRLSIDQDAFRGVNNARIITSMGPGVVKSGNLPHENWVGLSLFCNHPTGSAQASVGEPIVGWVDAHTMVMGRGFQGLSDVAVTSSTKQAKQGKLLA